MTLVRNNTLSDRNSGFYRIGDKSFDTKIETLIYATELKVPREDIKFIYFDSIWENSHTTKTINANLQDVFKLRAEQLRDEYDYLILNYSGGYDSWTILNIYLTHDIFLDEIVVKWPYKAVYNGNRNIHTPDINNKHPSNYLTEWEALIKDDLKLVAKLSPKTKITIYDFSDELLNVDEEKLIEKLPSNHFIGLPSVIRQGAITQSELKLSDDKKIASIYGVDKPILCRDGEDCFMAFNDKVAQVNGDNDVYFFWGADNPVVLIEMAHRVFEWFQIHKTQRHLIPDVNVPVDADNFKKYTTIVNFVCYPNYNHNRFQTDKPTSVIHHEKDTWARAIPEIQPAFNKWNGLLGEIFTKIDKRFLIIRSGIVHSFVTIHSKTHRIGTFT